MFFTLPPTNVSSHSTGALMPSFKPVSVIAKRMRGRTCHAAFWVIPNALANSYELIPFLQFTKSHAAGSHLSRPIGESSKMVPTLSENFRFGCLVLQL